MKYKFEVELLIILAAVSFAVGYQGYRMYERYQTHQKHHLAPRQPGQPVIEEKSNGPAGK